jgi:hypothetical protein
VFLVVSILAYMFTQKKERQYFRTHGPYVTTLIAFLIFLPHVIWSFYHDFPAIHYAVDKDVMARWLAPFYFMGGQLLYVILPTALLTPMLGFIWKWKVQHHEQCQAKECEKFLLYCFLIPTICHVLYGGIMGVKVLMAYGAPFWTFFGLWLLLRFQHVQVTRRAFRQVATMSVTVMLCIAAGFITLVYGGLDDPKHHIPMRELGAACDQLWRTHVPATRCPYIAGNNFLLFGHAAHAMSVRPSVIMPQGTWADDGDLNQKGGLIVWERTGNENEMPEKLRQRFPKAEVLPEAPELHYKAGVKNRTLKLGIAIVPPPKMLSQPFDFG